MKEALVMMILEAIATGECRPDSQPMCQIDGDDAPQNCVGFVTGQDGDDRCLVDIEREGNAATVWINGGLMRGHDAHCLALKVGFYPDTLDARRVLEALDVRLAYEAEGVPA